MASLARKLVEPLFLSQAIGRALGIPSEHAARASELARAARRRAAAARALRSEEHDVAALRLEWEAASLALQSLAAAKGEPPAASARAAWAALDSLALPGAPPGLAATRALLDTDDPLRFDALGGVAARRARAELRPTLDWLLGLAEPRGVRELEVARIERLLASAAGLAGATWLVLWLFVWPNNEAWFKPAAMSSLARGSAQTENLTDGRSGTPLSVTERQHEPWARVDLLSPVVIEAVTLHGSKDTSLPLVIELSEDDRQFVEAARIHAPAAKGRWKVGMGAKRARFVRIRHPGEGVLALSEVEVWGRADQKR